MNPTNRKVKIMKLAIKLLGLLISVLAISACQNNEHYRGPNTGFETSLDNIQSMNERSYEDQYKPNDTEKDAQLITLNSNIHGHLRESGLDYVDVYKVVVPAVGEVHINLIAPPGVTLYVENDRLGYVYAGNYRASSGVISDESFVISQAGTYYVTIYSHNNEYGDYSFSLRNDYDSYAEYHETYEDFLFQVTEGLCIQVTADQEVTLANGNYSQGTCLADSGLDIVGSCPISIHGSADFYYEARMQSICNSFF